MALSAKQSALIKSYWHAAIAIEVTFASSYLIKLSQGTTKFDWYTFTYSAVGALVAPVTRAIVAKWPLLSPLTYRVTTKFASLAPAGVATTSNSSASVTTVTTAPTATTSASGA